MEAYSTCLVKQMDMVCTGKVMKKESKEITGPEVSKWFNLFKKETPEVIYFKVNPLRGTLRGEEDEHKSKQSIR